MLLRITLLLLFALVPLWLSTRRARRQFRARFGREPEAHELDSIGAWLREPQAGPAPAPPPAQPPAGQASPAQPSPTTSFGREPGA